MKTCRIDASVGKVEVENEPGNGTTFHLYFKTVDTNALPQKIAPLWGCSIHYC